MVVCVAASRSIVTSTVGRSMVPPRAATVAEPRTVLSVVRGGSVIRTRRVAAGRFSRRIVASVKAL